MVYVLGVMVLYSAIDTTPLVHPECSESTRAEMLHCVGLVCRLYRLGGGGPRGLVSHAGHMPPGGLPPLGPLP